MRNGEILLTGGTVINPKEKACREAALFIKNGHIAETSEAKSPEQVIDVSDCLVLPGLIDFHCHLFHSGTEIGAFPDSALLPQGVTTAVDQGSAGLGNFEIFYRSIIETSLVRIFAFLNVAPTGLTTTRYMENIDPRYYDEPKFKELFDKYHERLLGLKIRQSAEVAGELGILPLQKALSIGQRLHKPLVVHVTNPPCKSGKLAKLLRSGDVYTHTYSRCGSSILDSDNRIQPQILQARERGVLFDSADAREYSNIKVIQTALASKFYPDFISTDLTKGNLYDPVTFGLPMIMSKYYALGMPLLEIVKACTLAPARIIGADKNTGTLNLGACADVSIFRLKESKRVYVDCDGNSLQLKKIFVPMITILNGKIVYRNMEI